jgi:hypothetical protein
VTDPYRQPAPRPDYAPEPDSEPPPRDLSDVGTYSITALMELSEYWGKFFRDLERLHPDPPV